LRSPAYHLKALGGAHALDIFWGPCGFSQAACKPPKIPQPALEALPAMGAILAMLLSFRMSFS
jgi:hypothetical protein